MPSLLKRSDGNLTPGSVVRVDKARGRERGGCGVDTNQSDYPLPFPLLHITPPPPKHTLPLTSAIPNCSAINALLSLPMQGIFGLHVADVSS